MSAALHELIGDPDDGTHWPFTRVARELQNGEARIVGAAHVHNDLAQALNETVSTFPSSVFAKLAGVGTVPQFEFAPMLDHVEAADAARSAATTDDAEPGTAAA